MSTEITKGINLYSYWHSEDDSGFAEQFYDDRHKVRFTRIMYKNGKNAVQINLSGGALLDNMEAYVNRQSQEFVVRMRPVKLKPTSKCPFEGVDICYDVEGRRLAKAVFYPNRGRDLRGVVVLSYHADHINVDSNLNDSKGSDVVERFEFDKVDVFEMGDIHISNSNVESSGCGLSCIQISEGNSTFGLVFPDEVDSLDETFSPSQLLQRRDRKNWVKMIEQASFRFSAYVVERGTPILKPLDEGNQFFNRIAARV